MVTNFKLHAVLLRNNLSLRPRLICVRIASRLRTFGVRLAYRQRTVCVCLVSGSVTDAEPKFIHVKRRYHVYRSI